MESAGVRVTPPGPSQWKSGVPVTPWGRVREQERVTVSPAMMEEGEEVREMVAGSEETSVIYMQCYSQYIRPVHGGGGGGGGSRGVRTNPPFD